MNPFEKMSDEEIRRINDLQRELFDKIYQIFEPPLPEGVPERLERIVASAGIPAGASVLDVGSGTGIMVPLIRACRPARIFACDLSDAMLERLRENHPDVETLLGDVRNLELPTGSLDAVLVNACYPNIADKATALSNIRRMTKPGGRLAISHPLGRAFVGVLRKNSPFPLDDFPERAGAEALLRAFGFGLTSFVDEPELYILVGQRDREEGE